MKRIIWVLMSVLVVAVLVRLLAPGLFRTGLSELDPVIAYSKLSVGSKLGAAYLKWQAAHEQNAGDHNVVIRLGWSKGLSEESTRARGVAKLDLIEGRVRVEVTDFADSGVADVWLVDNQPGPGHSVRPDVV